MTMTRVVASGVLALGMALSSPAEAQVMVLAGDACVMPRACESGSTCPATDDHPVFLLGTCFCAPGATTTSEPPALCCTSPTTGSCGPGATCTLFTDSSGGVCIPTGVTYCGATATSVSRATGVLPCHTAPDAAGGDFTPYWRAGDCDRDGVPNGEEALDPLRDPCNPDDLHTCLSADAVSDGECCRSLSDDTAACCFLGSTDPIACCAAQPEFGVCCAGAAAMSPTDELTPLACCVSDDTVTDPATCCPDGTDGAACCEALEGPPGLCCETGIFCPPEDAGVTPEPDANVASPDGGVAIPDAGSPPGEDAGPTMDAGPTPLPPDTVGFGGGGGCRCAVGRSAPSLPLLVGLGLAIAIPLARSRRRR